MKSLHTKIKLKRFNIRKLTSKQLSLECNRYIVRNLEKFFTHYHVYDTIKTQLKLENEKELIKYEESRRKN